MKIIYKDNGWKKRYAIFPFRLTSGGETTIVWLEWYWVRFEGLYNRVSLEEPYEL